MFEDCRNAKLLDSRLRGNDGMGIKFNRIEKSRLKFQTTFLTFCETTESLTFAAAA